MKISLTTEDGHQMYFLEVSDDMDLGSFKALCEIETSMPTNEISLFFEGKELTEDSKSLNAFNIKDNAILLSK